MKLGQMVDLKGRFPKDDWELAERFRYKEFLSAMMFERATPRH